MAQTSSKVTSIWDLILKLLARISLIMGNLSAAGVNLLESLEIAKSVSSNVVVTGFENVKKESFLRHFDKIIFKRTLFPPTLVNLFQLVNKQDNDVSFNSVWASVIWKSEFDVAVDNMSSLIKPIMIVIYGINDWWFNDNMHLYLLFTEKCTNRLNLFCKNQMIDWTNAVDWF